MTIQRHSALIGVSITAWLAFYLLGLPSNYFVDRDTAEKILLSLITLFAIVPYISAAFRLQRNQRPILKWRLLS